MLQHRSTRRVLHGWPTRRFELLTTRVCDLDIGIEGSVHEEAIARVRRDLARRGLKWFPEVYLSTGWHCPDRVPVIGVPFTLATAELRRLEREVTAELETPAFMVQLLRHEVGHAYNYALGLFESREWRELFGPMSLPYREKYSVRPRSRQYVRHLHSHYAQKHPDEDFAETFAVWLTPRARWRRQHAGWGALRKLEYVDNVMRGLRGWHPGSVRGDRVEPVEELEYTVAQYYRYQGYTVDDVGLEDEAVAYFDRELRAVFRGRRLGGPVTADVALRRIRREVVGQVAGLLGVHPAAARDLYDKYVERAGALGIETGRGVDRRLLVNVTTMMATHLLNRRYAGRFSVPQRLFSCR